MFRPKISTELDNGLEVYCLQVNNSEFKVIPEQGCKISQLTLQNRKVIQIHGDLRNLQKDPLYQSCFLAPFPNRIAGGKYNFEGRKYALEINEKERGHALHGLFYNRLFRFVSKEITENRAVITFQSSLVKNEFTGYPFALHIEIQFTLRVEELEIQVTATNQGEVNLPYGVGWHPYFLSKSMINNSELKLPSTEVMEFSKEEGMELIPTGNSISSEGMQDNHLGDTKLDTCFLNPESRPVVFEDLEIKMDSQMKYLQIYTPEDRKSIAIEPMSCAPDSYNNQLGLITLKPEEKIRHTFGVKLNNNQI